MTPQINHLLAAGGVPLATRWWSRRGGGGEATEAGAAQDREGGRRRSACDRPGKILVDSKPTIYLFKKDRGRGAPAGRLRRLAPVRAKSDRRQTP